MPIIKKFGSWLLQKSALMQHLGRIFRHRFARFFIRSLCVIIILGALIATGLMVAMHQGLLRVDGLAQEVSKALNDRLEAGWKAEVGEASLSWQKRRADDAGSSALASRLGIEARWLKIINPQGHVIVSAPHAFVDMDQWGLLRGRFNPKAIGFSKLDLRLNVGADGRLKLGNNTDKHDSAISTNPTSIAATLETAPIATSIASIMAGLSTTEGVFGKLDRVKLEHARILLVDPQDRQTTAFDDVNIRFERISETHKRFYLNVDQHKGGWAAEGVVVGRIGKPRQIQVGLNQVRLKDLLLLSGHSNTIDHLDARLSGQIVLNVLENGEVKEADLTLSATTLAKQTINLKGTWLTLTRTMTINALEGLSGALSGTLQGALVQRESGVWDIGLTGQNLKLAADIHHIDHDKPKNLLPENLAPENLVPEQLTLENIEISGNVAQDFTAGEMNIITRAQSGQATAKLEINPAVTPQIKAQVSLQNMPANLSLALWPNSLSQWTQSYLVQALQSGVFEKLDVSYKASFDEASAALRAGGAQDNALNGSFVLKNALMKLTQGLPPLSNMTATGQFTGRSFTLLPVSARIQLDQSRFLNLEEGTMRIKDTLPARPIADIQFRMKGAANDLMLFLASPTLKEVTQLELEPKDMIGQADLRVKVLMPLATDVTPHQIQAQAQGAMTGVGFNQAFGSEKLEDGRFQLTFDKQGLSLKGDGKIAGIASQIEVKPPTRNQPGEVSAVMTLDEAGRIKRGINLSPYVTGVIPVKITMPLSRTPATPRIEADLTKTSIEGLIPSWSKPMGRSAKISFAFVKDDDNLKFNDLQAEAQNLSLKGQATFDPDDGAISIKLDIFKLSPGDDMKLDLTRSGDLTKIVIKGQVIDARPFLQMLSAPQTNTQRTTQSTMRKPTAPKGDLDLDVTTAILAGHNQEALTNVTLKMNKAADKTRVLKLNARLGSQNVTTDIINVASGVPMLVVQSGDAGGTLRFLDLYRRMQGGDMIFRLSPLEGRQRGELLVTTFVLKNEPALKRILAEQPAGANLNDRVNLSAQGRIDTSEVAFDTLKADFERQGTAGEGRYDIAEAVITGPQLGFTTQGMLDFNRNRIDMSGTFVPAYGLNNVFSQVPVIGAILGGGENEGLFAINFRVDGLMSSPTLNVNPLSALAPGIFRKLFGAGSSNNNNPATLQRNNQRER